MAPLGKFLLPIISPVSGVSKVDIDAYGRVIATHALTAGDLPTFDTSKISDFATAVASIVTNDIGITIQAEDADLNAIAVLSPADGTFIKRSGGIWTAGTLSSGDIPNNAANTSGSAASLSSVLLAAAFPALTGDVTTVAGELATTLKPSVTIVTPTIASFTNAQHTHQNAAGGGSLDAAAIGSGTLNNARVNWASPSAIGGTAAAAITGTSIVAKGNLATTKDGIELITNGSFAGSATGWTVGTGWAYSSNSVVHSSGTGLLSQLFSPTVGEAYGISFTISGRTSGSIAVYQGATSDFNNYSANQSYTLSYHASDTGGLAFLPTTDFDGAISAVSVQRLGSLVINQITDGALYRLYYNPSNVAVVLRNFADTGYSSFVINTLYASGASVSGSQITLNSIEINSTSFRGAARVINLLSASGISWASAFANNPDLYVSRGATASLSILGVDTATTTVTNGLTIAHTLTTANAGANGIGTGLLFQAADSTSAIGAGVSQGRVRTVWTTATDASRVANMILSVFDTSEHDIITLLPTAIALNTNVGIGTTSPGQLLDLYDGNLRFTQLAAPGAATAALAGLGAGNVNTGTHSYKVTFVTAAGETQAGTVSNTITTSAGNGQVALSAIPTGAAGTTSRKIYRTIAGNGGSYLLLTTINDNTTTTFADNVADASLGAAAPSLNTTGGAIFVGTTQALNIDQNGTAYFADLVVTKASPQLRIIDTSNGGLLSLQQVGNISIITSGTLNIAPGVLNLSSGVNRQMTMTAGWDANVSHDGSILSTITAAKNFTWNAVVINVIGSFKDNAGSLLFDVRNNGSSRFNVETSGLVAANATNANTAVVANVLTIAHALTTANAGAAGIGTGLLFQAADSTSAIGAGVSQGRIRTLWTTATDASRVANMVLSVFNTAEVDAITITPTSITDNLVYFPLQAATVSAPTYVKGGVYFDTTLNKLRIGGASGWETVTSS